MTAPIEQVSEPSAPPVSERVPQRLTIWRLTQNGTGTDAAVVVNRRVSVFDVAQGVKTFCGVGTYRVRFPILNERYDTPRRGDFMLFTTGNTTLESGPILNWELEYVAATDSLQCTVEGVSEEYVLGDRIAYPDPDRWAEIQNTRSHDTRSGIASTVLMGYARANTRKGDPELGTWDRAYGRLAFAPDPMLGAPISMTERWSYLLDVLQRAAIKGSVGFRVVRSVGADPEFQVYQPRDRSSSAVFDVRRGNVESMSWKVAAPTVSAVISGGQGEMTQRMITQDRDSDREFAWRRRTEVFRDQRAENNKDQLRSDAQAMLAEGAETEYIKVTPTSSPLARYGDIYELGDTVRARMVTRSGRVLREVVDRVQQVEWKATPAGLRVTPIIGTDGSSDLTGAATKALSKRLNQIEGAQ